ncbi:MAG: hypothetical protein E7051_04085 [Lentisphaerae bacterium]|nr:hypothetical protein [Lentisphaerota bacterium]
MKNAAIFLFAGMLLTLTASPELTVPQNIPPKFDGVVDSAEYRSAVELNNFFLSDTAAFPQEKSSVSLLHDGKHFYAGAVLKAYALNPFSNMGKEFKATLYGEKQPVWEDDSFELRALSESGERFYFGFNANGATFIRIPARFHADMPQVRCYKGKGFFSAELKLPLELLNGKWNINFVRFEKRLKETSTLLPQKSYNLWAYDQFWKLSKGKAKTVSPVLCDLANANTGNLELSFPAAVSGEYKISANGSTLQKKFSVPAASVVKIAFPDSKKGANKFSLSVKTQGGKWNFPEYSVPSPDSQFSVSWEGEGIRMFFNGESIASGAILPMAKKQNTLEIVSDKPQVTFFMRHSGYENAGFPGSFEGAEQFYSQGFKKTLTAPEDAKAPYKFRKIFTSTPALINPWGVEKQKLLLSSGDALDFEINPVEWGIFPVENIEIKLLVPEEVELLDAVSRIRYPDGFAPFLWIPESNMYKISAREKCSVDGKNFQLITVKRAEKLIKVPNMAKLYHSMRERCHLIFRSKNVGFKGDIHFFVMAGKPSLAENPKIIPVEVTEKLQGVQPKKLTVSLYAQMQGNLDWNLEKELFKTYKNAGINELFLETERPDIKDFTMMFFLEVSGHGYYRSVPAFETLFFRKHPHMRAKSRSGKPRDVVSLTALGDIDEKTEKDLTGVFAALKTKYPSLKKLFWDFEHPPFGGLYADYSEGALAKFKKDYKISEEKITPELLEKKYADKWIDFRARELGRSVAVIRRIANKNGYKLVMYSDYATPDCAKNYGVNWEYIRSAADEVYCGYGRDINIIRKTKELVAPSKTVFGLLTNRGSSTRFRSQILRRILDSRGGVLCWYERGAGVFELQEIAAVTKVVTQCENAIIEGIDVEPANLKHNGVADNVVTRKLGCDNYTFILNEENLTGRIKITFPAPAQDLTTGKIYPAGKKLSLKIPAMKFAAFKWKDN